MRYSYFPCYFISRSVGYIAATQPLAIVPVLLPGILTYALLTLATSFFLSVSSCQFSSVFASIPASIIGYSALHFSTALVVPPDQLSSPSTSPSSFQTLVVLEFAASSTPPRDPVSALLQKPFVRRDAEFAELDAAFRAVEKRILELESSLVKAAADEANLCYQASSLQTDLAAMSADPTASKTTIVTTASELYELRASIRRLDSQVSDLVSIEESFHFQLSNPLASVLLAALDSLRDEGDRNLGLLRYLAGQIDRLDSSYTTLATRARYSRASHRRGVDPSIEKLHVPANGDDISEDASLYPLTV